MIVIDDSPFDSCFTQSPEYWNQVGKSIFLSPTVGHDSWPMKNIVIGWYQLILVIKIYVILFNIDNYTPSGKRGQTEIMYFKTLFYFFVIKIVNQHKYNEKEMKLQAINAEQLQKGTPLFFFPSVLFCVFVWYFFWCSFLHTFFWNFKFCLPFFV